MVDVQNREPSVQLFVRREAAVRALPQVTVRGNKSGQDPFSTGIVRSRGGYTGRRRACAEGGDGLIVPDGNVTNEGFFLPRSHR